MMNQPEQPEIQPQNPGEITDWTQGLLAKIGGEMITELPQDLYIPPEALRVFLETFEGPLDLLLYLIKKQNLDILDIPISDITKQYMEYIDLMQNMQLELAGDYLVMAATLAEIKSRMLLPRVEVEGEEPDDPRADLVRRLQEYERFKKAADNLSELPRTDRDFYIVEVEKPPMEFDFPEPDVAFPDLLDALRDVMARARLFSHHHIQMEALSIRERMTDLMERVSRDHYTRFVSLFTAEEGRMGVVVTLIAILELVRSAVFEITQAEPFAPLYVKHKIAEGIHESE
jgi:segregation and condensation protein A